MGTSNSVAMLQENRANQRKISFGLYREVCKKKLMFVCLFVDVCCDHIFPCLFKVAVGSSHVAMVTWEHAVFTWGSNCFGQLGHGDGSRRDKPTQVEALKAKTILK